MSGADLPTGTTEAVANLEDDQARHYWVVQTETSIVTAKGQ